MGQVVEFMELARARRHRAEKQSTDQCIEFLEWNLKHNVDRYLCAPYSERLFRATRIRKLSEVLEYALRFR